MTNHNTVSYEQMRHAATAQAQDRADRQGAPMHAYSVNGSPAVGSGTWTWYVRPCDGSEGAVHVDALEVIRCEPKAVRS